MRALSAVPVPGGGQRGGAVCGSIPAWALSAVLILPPRSCSPSRRPVPGVSLPAPSQSLLREFSGPLGSSGLALWALGAPLPPTERRQHPFPPPRPQPLPASPRSLPSPLISPAPQLPPTARSPVPVTLLGVYAWRPPWTPPRRPGAPRSPGPTAPQPRSSEWRRSRGGRCGTPGAASAGKESASPTQPCPDPGPLWLVAPSGPKGEEAGGHGGVGAGAAPGAELRGPSSRSPGRGGVELGTAARGRRTGPTSCWKKLCSTAQTQALLGPGGDSEAARSSRLNLLPPPSTHVFLSACLSLSSLEPLFPVLLRLPIPHPFSGSHIQGVIRGEHQD